MLDARKTGTATVTVANVTVANVMVAAVVRVAERVVV